MNRVTLGADLRQLVFQVVLLELDHRGLRGKRAGLEHLECALLLGGRPDPFEQPLVLLAARVILDHELVCDLDAGKCVTVKVNSPELAACALLVCIL